MAVKGEDTCSHKGVGDLEVAAGQEEAEGLPMVRAEGLLMVRVEDLQMVREEGLQMVREEDLPATMVDQELTWSFNLLALNLRNKWTPSSATS